MTGRRSAFAALAVALAMLAGHHNLRVPAAQPAPAVAVASPVPAPVTLAGLDAHDGTIVQDGATLYLYGTRYGCGFTWGVSSPWCGFGVWTSTSGLGGPWTFQRLLFDPNGSDSWDGNSWQTVCGSQGRGCFNPRMVRRPDGVWILWFNTPYDEVTHSANGYYVMGCNGPAGPCGRGAGPPYGSSSKPAMYECGNSGDFSIIVDGGVPYLLCNLSGSYPLAAERLDGWWANGSTIGARNLGGLTNVEAPGGFRTADGTWVLTYADPACGYCAGTATGYAVAASPLGPWTWPANPSLSGGDPGARRRISAHSCGGQPRTVVTVDGQAFEWVDLWTGQRNETGAGIHLEPLNPRPPYTPPPDGTLWAGGLQPFTCD
jgi:hypothetical protein